MYVEVICRINQHWVGIQIHRRHCLFRVYKAVAICIHTFQNYNHCFADEIVDRFLQRFKLKTQVWHCNFWLLQFYISIEYICLIKINIHITIYSKYIPLTFQNCRTILLWISLFVAVWVSVKTFATCFIYH